MPAGYLNFDLRIEQRNDEYRALVLDSPTGQTFSDFTLPYTQGEIENFWLSMAPSSHRDGMTQLIRDFGERLFNAVFKDEVLICFLRSIDEVDRQNTGLRIRLRLNEVPMLSRLPWEFLYARGRLLSLDRITPIVRFMELNERILPLQINVPLRILVIISSPYDYPRLNVESEFARLEDALRELTQQRIVTLDRLDHATRQSLHQELSKKDYHIVHFIGHGDWDDKTNEAKLILENSDNCGSPVSGEELGMLLHNHRSLRLVLLNACEGSRSASGDPFSGIAQQLVRFEIPAVIAMQSQISDDAAITFAEKFYKNLSENGTVDSALAEARIEIFACGNNAEWGIPVLYLRTDDGKIFDVKKDPGPPDPTPFFFGPPIIRPYQFYGREYQLQQLFNLWRQASLQNAAVVGPQRSGKTSLLYYLKNITTTSPDKLRPGQRYDWLPTPERYRWIFVDFLNPRLGSQQGLIRYLLAQMELPVTEQCDLLYFLKVVGDNIRTPTIILFNGIEYALRHYPELDYHFWTAMRALTDDEHVQGNLAFVSAIDKKPVEVHSGPPEVLSSPFFNKVGYCAELGPFKEEEARELVANSPLEFSEKDIEWIFKNLCLYPACLQILCRERFSALKRNDKSETWKVEGLDQIKKLNLHGLCEPIIGHRTVIGVLIKLLDDFKGMIRHVNELLKTIFIKTIRTHKKDKSSENVKGK